MPTLHRFRFAAVLALMLAVLLESTQAQAAAFDCTDEHGLRIRSGSAIDSAMTHVTCEPVSVAPPHASHPRRESLLLWLAPLRQGSSAASGLEQRPPQAGIQGMVESAALTAGHDPDLVHAIVQVESAFNIRARSPAGAIGLMQIMPATGRRYGVPNPDSLFEPGTNLRVGMRYLADLMQLFGDRIDLVIAAYNAGEGAVIQHGYRVPPYKETRTYVRDVLSAYRGIKDRGGLLREARGGEPQ